MKKLLLIIILLWARSATAATCTTTTANANQGTVQTAINAAASGDVVCVPAGSATWNTPVSLNGKRITLQGNGVGSTVITTTTNGRVININCTTTNQIELSGFTFTHSASNGEHLIDVDGTTFNICFWIHDTRLRNTAATGHVGILVTDVYGHMDHMTFDNEVTSGSIQMLSVFGTDDSSDAGFLPWSQPFAFGSINAVYLEDSTFNYPVGAAFQEDCIDAYGGAKLVVRYSTFNNDSIGFHGTDSGGRRSPVIIEIYNNTFVNNSGSNLRAATYRGGTGVVFGNTYTNGTHNWDGITLMVYRACPPLDQSDWGTCASNDYRIADNSPSSVWKCVTSGGEGFSSVNRESHGTFGTGNFTTFFDGQGTGKYPCRDQPGIAPGQIVTPIYAWSNGSITIGTYDGGNSCGLGLSTYLQSGRDYVNNGTTPKPGYTAFTYPWSASGGANPPVSLRRIRTKAELINNHIKITQALFAWLLSSFY